MEILCPFCFKKQKQKPKKSWRYGKLIKKRTEMGTKWIGTIYCSRFKCSCGKSFNFYKSPKTTWTIPKKNSLRI